MRYLKEDNIRKFQIDWKCMIELIGDVVRIYNAGDFSQPLKPYLRYGNTQNRIISMPAYVGGTVRVAGIKWIASFPENIYANLPRAHSVVVLNDSDTGKPIGIINSSLLSTVRTAAVSGLIVDSFCKNRSGANFNIGIIGWGPIGQYHLRMLNALLGDKILNIFLYDLRNIDKSSIDFVDHNKITVADTWREVYSLADIFVTCTVAQTPFIDSMPKRGSLHLNVSLRDYCLSTYDYFKDSIIVDNWVEVCREGTNIEQMAKERGLSETDTKSIIDVVINNCLKDYKEETPVMFNPMGMAIFDIALGKFYLDELICLDIGTEL